MRILGLTWIGRMLDTLSGGIPASLCCSPTFLTVSFSPRLEHTRHCLDAGGEWIVLPFSSFPPTVSTQGTTCVGTPYSVHDRKNNLVRSATGRARLTVSGVVLSTHHGGPKPRAQGTSARGACCLGLPEDPRTDMRSSLRSAPSFAGRSIPVPI